MTGKPIPADVAAWMMREFERCAPAPFYQEVVVYDIAEKFGEEFTYTNANGNLALEKAVLDAFRRVSGDGVVWSRST